ncbi:hypothetical protein P9112_014157 [Eukaryota sp. TZLM1-RC]
MFYLPEQTLRLPQSPLKLLTSPSSCLTAILYPKSICFHSLNSNSCSDWILPIGYAPLCSAIMDPSASIIVTVTVDFHLFFISKNQTIKQSHTPSLYWSLPVSPTSSTTKTLTLTSRSDGKGFCIAGICPFNILNIYFFNWQGYELGRFRTSCFKLSYGDGLVFSKPSRFKRFKKKQPRHDIEPPASIKLSSRHRGSILLPQPPPIKYVSFTLDHFFQKGQPTHCNYSADDEFEEGSCVLSEELIGGQEFLPVDDVVDCNHDVSVVYTAEKMFILKKETNEILIASSRSETPLHMSLPFSEQIVHTDEELSEIFGICLLDKFFVLGTSKSGLHLFDASLNQIHNQSITDFELFFGLQSIYLIQNQMLFLVFVSNDSFNIISTNFKVDSPEHLVESIDRIYTVNENFVEIFHIYERITSSLLLPRSKCLNFEPFIVGDLISSFDNFEGKLSPESQILGCNRNEILILMKDTGKFMFQSNNQSIAIDYIRRGSKPSNPPTISTLIHRNQGHSFLSWSSPVKNDPRQQVIFFGSLIDSFTLLLRVSIFGPKLSFLSSCLSKDLSKNKAFLAGLHTNQSFLILEVNQSQRVDWAVSQFYCSTFPFPLNFVDKYKIWPSIDPHSIILIVRTVNGELFGAVYNTYSNEHSQLVKMNNQFFDFLTNNDPLFDHSLVVFSGNSFVHCISLPRLEDYLVNHQEMDFFPGVALNVSGYLDQSINLIGLDVIDLTFFCGFHEPTRKLGVFAFLFDYQSNEIHQILITELLNRFSLSELTFYVANAFIEYYLGTVTINSSFSMNNYLTEFFPNLKPFIELEVFRFLVVDPESRAFMTFCTDLSVQSSLSQSLNELSNLINLGIETLREFIRIILTCIPHVISLSEINQTDDLIVTVCQKVIEVDCVENSDLVELFSFLKRIDLQCLNEEIETLLKN